jgi:hypothetical protein
VAVFEGVDTILENLPKYTSPAVSYGPHRAVTAEFRQQTVKQMLERRALGLDRRLRRWGEDPPDEAVSLGGAGVAVWLGAFCGSRANAGPRAERRGGGKGGRVGTPFRHHRLCRLYQEPRPLCYSFYGLFVLLPTRGQGPIQRLNLLVQPWPAGSVSLPYRPVERPERAAECISQCFFPAWQAVMAPSRLLRRIAFSLR